jgi:hypothetical protein
MADVTVERNSELTKELALLKSRNKTLGNLVNVEKDVLIKSKDQATAMGELGDNVKSIGNNLLSGAESFTSSIFGGSLGGILNSLTVGMVKRRNDNAKIEKEKAKEESKATESAKFERQKILNSLVDTLKLTDEHRDTSREQLEAMIKASELEKEIAEQNEEIKKQKAEALALIGGESSFIGPLLPDGGRGTESPELEELRKIASGVETKEEKNERLRRETSKDKGGQVIKLEGAEDTSGFSLMDIFSKGGRGKLLGSLATGLTGIASFAFSKEGGLFSAMKGVQFGKTAGFALLAGGIVAIATDTLKGIVKSKEWGVGTGDAAIGAALGGVNSGVEGAMGQAAKYGAIGAGLGSIFPGVGTLIGGILGALFGAIMGYFGGERISKGIASMRGFLSTQWNGFLSLFGADDKEQTKRDNIKEIEDDKKKFETFLAKEKDKKGKTMEQLQSEALAAKRKEMGREGGRLSAEEVDTTRILTRQSGVYDASRVSNLEERISGFGTSLETEKGRDLEQEALDAKIKTARDRVFSNKSMLKTANVVSKKRFQEQLKIAEMSLMTLDPNYKPVSEGLAKGGFIVNKPTYLPGSGVMVGDSVSGATRDGGPEAIIPLNSPQAAAFIDPMARSVAGQVMNRLQMEGMSGGAGGSGASVVTGNDMSSSQTNNSTTVINNPSPIGQMLPDEGRSFVSKVA